jgi:hypothetical protein
MFQLDGREKVKGGNPGALTLMVSSRGASAAEISYFSVLPDARKERM